MRIEFDESFALPIEEVFAYFRSPADWVRLYGFAGKARELPDGWTAVPLKRFPFPLVARVTERIENRRVAWIFRGFWKGSGAVDFAREGDRTRVRGFEEIAVRYLGPLSRPLEKLALERQFRFIWALGWRRLRKREATSEAR